MPRALLSVFDKTGIEAFASQLHKVGFDLISTGGTYEALRRAELPVTPVKEETGSPEMLQGRVKTLHPHIHGGILAKRTPAQLAELDTHGITPIDVVVVNLYPFRQAAQQHVTEGGLGEVLEQIDIGGPTMIRAAAKNFPSVVVLVDPEDYSGVAAQLAEGEVPLETRQKLALKAFAHTAAYDSAISHYFTAQLEAELPAEGALELTRITDLRYGENPHQKASLWRLGNEQGPVLDAEVLQGKAMSFNNYQDADAAWNLLHDLPSPAAVAVKHANPCGVALGKTLLEAYQQAHDADPVSIFGGIVALNDTVDGPLAQTLNQTFLEIVLAPEFTLEARDILAKKPNVRLLKVQATDTSTLDMRRIRGGLLVQDVDRGSLDGCPDLKVVSRKQPDEAQWEALRFAWTVAKHTKSNAIVLTKEQVTVGIGVGQVSRIWAAEQALAQAGEKAQGSVLASDAFFPFDDVVTTAAKAGVTWVISPGGSRRDAEVIAAADALDVGLVFTGMRHFRH